MNEGTPVERLPAGWNWGEAATASATEAVCYLRYNHRVRYVVFQAQDRWRFKHTPDGLGARSDVVYIRAFADVEDAKRACEEAAGA